MGLISIEKTSYMHNELLRFQVNGLTPNWPYGFSPCFTVNGPNTNPLTCLSSGGHGALSSDSRGVGFVGAAELPGSQYLSLCVPNNIPLGPQWFSVVNNNGVAEAYVTITVVSGTGNCGSIGTGCKSNTDCPPGLVCLNGICVSPPLVTSYNCVNNQCVNVEGSGGQYTTLDACRAACQQPPPNVTYNCQNRQCVTVQGTGGQYASLAACQAACQPVVMNSNLLVGLLLAGVVGAFLVFQKPRKH